MIDGLDICFTIPIKVYIAKEYYFMLHEEILNRTFTRKIDELKHYSSNNMKYTNEMIKKVKGDIYEIIRHPYLK